ncbi:MAG: NAD(P)/FAD-dependent oxidoreductase [Cellulomonadaceae bacterium]|nr:NAD(P)/FAD-dependent oxidoreductase [Cellulomonadaceae bacterium]
MRSLVVLGAGTAGTMVVNKLRPRLPADEWTITVVDPSDMHYYQPDFLFLAFGMSRPRDAVRPRARTLTRGVRLVRGEVDRVDPVAQRVHLVDGKDLAYDYLVIATGTTPRPDQTPGMAEGMGDNVHEFYTYAGANALAAKLASWPGGRLLVHVTEMPIKCPVAPLEFTFLADAFFTERGLRPRVDLTYVTPLPGAFTKPVAADQLGDMLARRRIGIEPDFVVEQIDSEAGTLTSFDERVLEFDLLVTIPVNMGADFIARSGLGDELNFVPVDRHTLLSKAYDTIFAIGDATDVPTSKAGSVAHFQADALVPNFLAHVQGLPMPDSFDGHANCFIETGFGKGMLIDFNYDTEPLPGMYPLPVVGPMRLLRETHLNHWGKRAFRWVYWSMLLPGRRLPVPAHMSMAGKRVPVTATTTATPPVTPVGLT